MYQILSVQTRYCWSAVSPCSRWINRPIRPCSSRKSSWSKSSCWSLWSCMSGDTTASRASTWHWQHSRKLTSNNTNSYDSFIDDETDAKILTAAPFENWSRPLRHPYITWIQQDMKSSNLSLNEATDVAQNCPLMSTFGSTHSQWCMRESNERINDDFWHQTPTCHRVNCQSGRLLQRPVVQSHCIRLTTGPGCHQCCCLSVKFQHINHTSSPRHPALATSDTADRVQDSYDNSELHPWHWTIVLQWCLCSSVYHAQSDQPALS